jgi:hypothetical protein
LAREKEQQMPRGQATGTSKDDAGRAEADVTGDARSTDESVAVRGSAGFRLPGMPGTGQIEPRRMLLWGGLAALAVVEIIEWPVALAIGAGSYLTEQLTKRDVEQDRSRTTS